MESKQELPTTKSDKICAGTCQESHHPHSARSIEAIVTYVTSQVVCHVRPPDNTRATEICIESILKYAISKATVLYSYTTQV